VTSPFLPVYSEKKQKQKKKQGEERVLGDDEDVHRYFGGVGSATAFQLF